MNHNAIKSNSAKCSLLTGAFAALLATCAAVLPVHAKDAAQPGQQTKTATCPEMTVDTNPASGCKPSMSFKGSTTCVITAFEVRGTGNKSCKLTTPGTDKSYWTLEAGKDANAGARCTARCFGLSSH